MEPIFVAFITLAVGVGGYVLGFRDGLKEKKLPYRWACMHEGCKFSVASSDMNFTMVFADRHSETAHKD